jgi:hypothetical protein
MMHEGFSRPFMWELNYRIKSLMGDLIRRWILKTGVLAMILSVLVFCSPLQAQEFKNDLSVSLGGATFPDITETAKEIGGIIGTAGFLRVESKRAIPAIIFNYGRFVNEDLRLSLNFCYQKFDVEHFIVDQLWFTTEVAYYDFMVRGDYTYLRREWVQLYSGAGIGLAVVIEGDVAEKYSDTEYWFAFHVNAFGCRVGKRVAGFVELGFGYDGIVAAGVTAAF